MALFSMSATQPTDKGAKLDKEISDRMAEIFFGMLQGEVPDNNGMAFFTNHVSSFTKLMNTQAVEALEAMGVVTEFAQLVIQGTALLNRMDGANSYNDFCITQEMAEMLGGEA